MVYLSPQLGINKLPPTPLVPPSPRNSAAGDFEGGNPRPAPELVKLMRARGIPVEVLPPAEKDLGGQIDTFA